MILEFADQEAIVQTRLPITVLTLIRAHLADGVGAWSESYPAMEFRHGPVSATNSSTLAWAIGPVDRDVLDAAAQAGPTVLDHGRDPMAELVLVQRAAAALAHARGSTQTDLGSSAIRSAQLTPTQLVALQK